MRFILAERCVRDTVPHHLLFACLYDNKSFTENKQLFWLVTAGKRTIIAMLAVTNLTSPSKLTNIVKGVCAYCLVHPCTARAGTAANATIFTLQNTLEYAGNRKICSIVAKNMRFCKYDCI
ncbi:hypothetical protein [Gemmiger formicilis]|uniref:hypothetical protein n=1 Tax=Gemmiger formicilis TaxID=745368 RepID=UPI003522AD1C